jgi:hypothetical protein
MGSDEAAITIDIALASLARPTAHDPPRLDPMRDQCLCWPKYKRRSPQHRMTTGKG